MSHVHDEDLLGFLLGALDDDERSRIESQLEEDDALRDRLITLQAALDPLEETKEEHDEPPKGLAELTCETVAAFEQSQSVKPQAVRHAGDPKPVGNGWRLVEVSFLSGMAIAAALLFMPMIAQSRIQSQIAACQNNLRDLGNALAGYSQTNVGRYPEIPRDGKLAFAGAYAPMLRQVNLVSNPRTFFCPAASCGNSKLSTDFPTLAQIEAADGENLVVLQTRSGGDYGFTLGFIEEGEYYPTRHEGRMNFPIMADAPSLELHGFESTNHGRRGQNVLFDDFHVEFVPAQRTAIQGDAFYLNRNGQPAAGLDIHDAVIGGSNARPIPVSLNW